MTALTDLWRNQRTRHVAIAALIAFALGISGIASPASNFLRILQSRLASHPASGQVVFIGAPEDLADPSSPGRRAALADLIDGLGRAGPARTFVTDVFDKPSTIEADRRLGDAVAGTSQIYFVRRHMTTMGGDETLRSLPIITGNSDEVVSKEWVDPFGFIWRLPFAVMDDGHKLPSLPAALAGQIGPAGESFAVDYSVSYSTIPAFTMVEAATMLRTDMRKAEEAFAGKTVVIGSGVANTTNVATIPGHPKVPGAMVSIYGAETLLAGLPPEFAWPTMLLFFTGLTLIVAVIKVKRGSRRIGYGLISLTLIGLFAFFTAEHWPANLAETAIFLAIYGGLRLWVARQNASALVHEATGLPTFKALERDLFQMGSVHTASVVVAKVHHFDEVLSALPVEKHGEYLNMIADRLRITQRDLKIYTNGGRYLAWAVQDHGDVRLEAHLKGLRAVFSSPLSVGGTAVDVVITFGVDSTSEGSPVRKIASATAAADKTSEAVAPIHFASASSEADRIWNISLQAKIDDALRTGEIYVVYQPQIDIRSGALFGAEALVRWEDPERGSISPSYFIEQCEQAGRMEALTRKVMRDALSTLAASPLAETGFQLSVNVSATLLADYRVAEILEEALAGVSLDPTQITLEITETARIVDYVKAGLVMERLRQTGVKLSVDDFGVGAASLETLHALPFDEVKIDRSFVAKTPDDRKARKIVESVTMLGKSLGMTVIAEGVEGVEGADVVERLKEAGCDIAQGYYFAKPAKFSRLMEFEAPAKRLTDGVPRRRV
ncbi:EAL domain-containing protein (putative c-di-GMP-specific phosphodiesterase class I)/GGDEF domain-containing protein [Altererythrobacter atlanticus]|uniref:Oxygen sensor protein DosP n=1 Tax=Croceibacterium atlanticum TaxID=1267766 RepID=A0A0F7KZ83_9SPHN|nr:EAL domain-containing protein [Croceibacterium atlanticum]AKH44145.1 Oxygen sensor protein DosP [Croceibacterium atlanticum]MBB5732455.1 EAL domain-containing protein (putative c-di-GMP-specific phosphodiesterase class I)/GGDEF domain-containing protein [Croceibacterium atlanticum]